MSKKRAASAVDSATTKGTKKAKVESAPKTAKGRPKSTRTKKAAASEEAVDDGLERNVDFSDQDITELLLAGIQESSDIKKALYPPPGSKSKSSTAKPKIEFQARLAEYAFASHERYGAAYRADIASGDKKRQQAWAIKVKNRLKTVSDLTRRYNDELGATGAGIHSLDEVDLTKKNNFTNLLEQILDASPWYFGFKALIAERPNTNPVGLGNNTTGVDMNVIAASAGPRGDNGSGVEEDGDVEDGGDGDQDDEGHADPNPKPEDSDEQDATSSVHDSPTRDNTPEPETSEDPAGDHSDASSQLDETFFNKDGSVNVNVKKGGKKKGAPVKGTIATTQKSETKRLPDKRTSTAAAASAVSPSSAADKVKARPPPPTKAQVKGKYADVDKFVLAHAEEEKTRQKALEFKIVETLSQKCAALAPIHQTNQQYSLAKVYLDYKGCSQA